MSHNNRPPPDPARTPDFHTGHLAGRTLAARAALQDLRALARGAAAPVLVEAYGALPTLVGGTYAKSGGAAGALEPAFLKAHEAHAQQQEQQARRCAALSEFRRRLTYVGTTTPPEFWSLLGWVEDDPKRPVALSRDAGQVILGCGIQGCGKTVLSTLLCEGSLQAGEPLTSPLILPTCYTFFHLEEQDRLPQLLDGLSPNPVAADLARLQERLGVGALGLGRMNLVVPEWLLPDLLPRLLPYQDLGLQVIPLRVRLGQLGQVGLECALGAESGARFVQRMLDDAQEQRDRLDLTRWRKFIDDAPDLNQALKRAAQARLTLLGEIASPPDGPGMWEMFEPGVVTVVYLGGPHMGHGRVVPILVGLMSGLVMPSQKHGPFQRVLVVDEVNLLDQDDAAWQAMIRVGRLVRRRGATLALLGQDLLRAPDALLGLAGICAVFRQRNPKVWEHLRERVGALRGWGFDDVSRLEIGEALLGATDTTDPEWRPGARRTRFRPPRCLHGGMTRAVI